MKTEMNLSKETQTLLWSCLPPQERRRQRECYLTGDPESNLRLQLFGQHNLETGEEPPEMIHVRKEKVDDLNFTLPKTFPRETSIQIQKALQYLLGDGFEYNLGDKVMFKGEIHKITACENNSGRIRYAIDLPGNENKCIFKKYDLEPYFEPQPKFNLGELALNRDKVCRIVDYNAKLENPYFIWIIPEDKKTWVKESDLKPYLGPKFKYNLGDLVTYRGKVKKIIEQRSDWRGNATYLCALLNGQSPLEFNEIDLEPYTEPENKDKKRKGWSEAFQEYAEEGEDPQLLPDHFDSEAIEILEMEEKQLNLCELLKGCEGENFFSIVHGEVTFYEKSFTQEDKYHFFFEKENGESFYTLQNGTFGRGIYPIIYPSRALYEKYPLDAYSAWMEWSYRRRRNTIRLEFIAEHINDEGEKDSAIITDEIRFASKNEMDEAFEELNRLRQKLHENRK